MIYFVKIIIQQENIYDYQQAIKTFLKILEMCIRKTIVINPNGIYKGLPISSVGEVVTNNNEGNTISSWFRKQLQTNYNKILAKQSVLNQKKAEQEAERLKRRGESQSVTKSSEAKMVGKFTERDYKQNNQKLTPISENITKVNEKIQPFSSSSQGFGSQEATQRDFESGNEEENEEKNEENKVESPKMELSEQIITENLITPEYRDTNERMQEQSSVASSTTTIPSRGPINPVPAVKQTRSSTLRAQQGEKVRQAKRKGGGTNNKVTFKHYKNSNNNYSIKNKQHFFKSKTIKHNKRKHTKTYKRK
jgi:hypothetical protein